MERLMEVARDIWNANPSQLMDQQRLERLEQCKVLQTVLDNCREPTPVKKGYFSRKTVNAKSDEERQLTLENTAGGIRMLRFFHWRELPENPATACQREEHALWACRAVAVGCGEPLTKLRDCFDQAGPRKILTQKEEGCYERNDKQKAIPCAVFQQAVGKCVAKNLHELQQRVAQRQSDEAK